MSNPNRYQHGKHHPLIVNLHGSYPWDVSCCISSLNIIEHRLSTISWSSRPGNRLKTVSQNNTAEQLGELGAALISSQPLRIQIVQRHSKAHQHIDVSAVPQSELVRTKNRLGLKQLDCQRQQQNRMGKVCILISRSKVQGTCDWTHPGIGLM